METFKKASDTEIEITVTVPEKKVVTRIALSILKRKKIFQEGVVKREQDLLDKINNQINEAEKMGIVETIVINNNENV